MDADLAAMAEARRPSVIDEKNVFSTTRPDSSIVEEEEDDGVDGVEPTAEELTTLRRVSGKITWQAMSVTAVEFCERFSYYGTTFKTKATNRVKNELLIFLTPRVLAQEDARAQMPSAQ